MSYHPSSKTSLRQTETATNSHNRPRAEITGLWRLQARKIHLHHSCCACGTGHTVTLWKGDRKMIMPEYQEVYGGYVNKTYAVVVSVDVLTRNTDFMRRHPDTKNWRQLVTVWEGELAPRKMDSAGCSYKIVHTYIHICVYIFNTNKEKETLNLRGAWEGLGGRKGKDKAMYLYLH